MLPLRKTSCKKELLVQPNSFLKKYFGFEGVADLNEYDNNSGYYMLVLDKYKQIYIGTMYNIKKRIREHWVKRRPFDRLIFGEVDT